VGTNIAEAVRVALSEGLGDGKSQAVEDPEQLEVL